MLQQRLFFTIYRLFHLAQGSVDRVLKPLDLDHRKFLALEIIYHTREIQQHRLASFLFLSPNLTVRLVDALQKRDLIVRKKRQSNRREQWVSLTKDGTALCQRILYPSKGLLNQVMPTLTHAEYRGLTLALKNIVIALEAFDQQN